MKIHIILLFITLKAYNSSPYLFGTSLNTKSVSNGKGINASETTVHALDDVAQSKTYGHGDREVSAKTDGEALWSNKIHGVASRGEASQNGNGDSLGDSWSKGFTPTKEFYLENYFGYVRFLNHLFKKKEEEVKRFGDVSLLNNENGNNSKNGQVFENENQNLLINTDKNFRISNKTKRLDINYKLKLLRFSSLERLKKTLKKKIDESIANYSDPSHKFTGEQTFDLQQSRASGKNTSASTSSKTFNWGRNNTIQKGTTISKSSKGWATTNNANWAISKNNYLTINKNSSAFGKNSSSTGESAIFVNKGRVYNSGKIWAQALGQDSFSYSNLNGNNFGFGALNGGSSGYSNGGKSVSLSEIRGMPYFPEVKKERVFRIKGPFVGEAIGTQ